MKATQVMALAAKALQHGGTVRVYGLTQNGRNPNTIYNEYFKIVKVTPKYLYTATGRRLRPYFDFTNITVSI